MATDALRTVLIVDDDIALGRLMQRRLQETGLQTSLATSGAEALSHVTREPPELLVLDFTLPDMNGLELLEKLSKQGSEVPFIVVTGRDDHQLAVRMMKRGARDYIVKDGSLSELLPSVVAQVFEQMDRDRRLAQAEDRIREQKRFLETILNSLSHPLYVLDAEQGKIEMVNRAALASGRTAFCLLRAGGNEPGSPALADSPIDRVKRTKLPFSFEHVHHGDSGPLSTHEVCVCPVLDDAGNVKQVIEYDLEITARKQAEQALRESDARLRQLLESLSIVLISSEASTKRINVLVGAVQEILGYEPQEFFNDPQLFRRMMDPRDAVIFERALIDAIAERRAFENDFRARHGADGRTIWIHIQAVPIFAEDGSLRRLDSVLVDVTREKQIAQEREQLEQQLEQTHRLESLGVLAGGIAHDFSNLLTIMSGNLQFLRETLKVGPAEAKALSDVEAAVRSASDMTRSLQAFSRPNKPEIRTVDANSLIKEFYRFLSRLLPMRVAFRFVAADEPCMVSADPAQLQQVLINLCINARDAISGQGQLEIRTGRIRKKQLPGQLSREADAAEYVQVCVSDNGCGMDSQTLRRVFDPFFTTKPKDQGRGLGLATVYKIVRAHNGLVHVTSTPGQGTRFQFFLPHTTPEPVASPPKPLVRGTEQILVVDDDEMIASLIKTVLESNGYKVAVVHRPEQAIELCQSSPEPMPLSVIDYGLPGMNGPECITRLREQWPALKAILITGYQVDVEELGLENVQVLQKPFSPHVIIEAVRRILDGSE